MEISLLRLVQWTWWENCSLEQSQQLWVSSVHHRNYLKRNGTEPATWGALDCVIVEFPPMRAAMLETRRSNPEHKWGRIYVWWWWCGWICGRFAGAFHQANSFFRVLASPGEQTAINSQENGGKVLNLWREKITQIIILWATMLPEDEGFL